MADSINIKEYVDYTEFLNDWFDHKKQDSNAFSYRIISEKAGFKSKSHLAEIVKGKKALARTAILNVSHALGLNDVEAEYFGTLVNYKTAKNTDEKNIHWTRILELQRPRINDRKKYAEYRLFECWYTLPVREIISVVNFKEDYRFLGKLVNPPITPKQAKESVEVLVELGLSEKKEIFYEQKQFDILVDPFIQKLAFRNYQKEILTLGVQSIDDLIDGRRNTQTICFGSNPSLNNRINKIIEQSIEDIYSAVQQFPEVDEVKQLNIQYFSLSKPNLTNR
ncbi:MAG: TIGR02147 family protein [Fibrobacterales bacterium]